MLVCYVSGHGFGHAVRVAEVVRALWGGRPDLPVHIRTTSPQWLFQLNLDRPFTHGACRLDIGVVQDDSLTLEPLATLRAYADLVVARASLIAAEVAALRPLRPSAILADIPALALDVAAELGVPGIAMTNFSWDWIYADYVRDFPAYAPLVDGLRTSYGQADLLLRLPLHGDLSAFPHHRDIPLVARKSTMPSTFVRERLGLPARERLILLSFGGIGVRLQTIPDPPAGVTFLVTETGHDTAAPPCRLVATRAMQAAGVRYQDLVAAVDAVMTKPGYGIVAECIANATPLIYTPRGRFAEYECLVRGIHAHLPHAFISNADLRAGRWKDALETVLSQSRRAPLVPINGADVAAEIIRSYLQ